MIFSYNAGLRFREKLRDAVARVEGVKFGRFKYEVGNDVVLIYISDAVTIPFIPIRDTDLERVPTHFPRYDTINAETDPRQISLMFLPPQLSSLANVTRENNDSRPAGMQDLAEMYGISTKDATEAFCEAQKVYKAWKLGKIKGDPTL